MKIVDLTLQFSHAKEHWKTLSWRDYVGERGLWPIHKWTHGRETTVRGH